MVDPRLIPDGLLDRLESRVGQIVNELGSFAQNQNEGHISNANSYASTLLTELTLPAMASRRGFRESSDVTKAFTDNVQELERQSEKATKELEQRLTEFGTKAEQLMEASNRASSDFKVQAASAEQEIKLALDTFRAELAAVRATIASFTESASVAWQSERGNALQEFEDKRVLLWNEVDERVQEHRNRWDTSMKEIQDEVEQVLTFFHSQETDVRKVLGAVAARETAGAYLREHEEQRQSANRWRWAATVAWLGAVAIALWVAHDVAQNSSALSRDALVAVSSARVAAGATAVGAAVWVARQSSHHRAREHMAIQVASELTTMPPFIAGLSGEEQHAALTEALPRFFPGKGHQNGSRTRAQR